MTQGPYQGSGQGEGDQNQQQPEYDQPQYDDQGGQQPYPPPPPPYEQPPQFGQQPQYGQQQYGHPPYGQPPYGQQPYGQFYGQRPDFPNLLIWAILVTLCCCLPGGVVSIIYSAQANSKRDAGDFSGALDAYNKAKFWLILSVVIGLIANFGMMVLQMAALLSGEFQGNY